MFHDAYALLSKGGVLMWPILAGSVFALAVFLERLWSLRRRRVISDRFVQDVTKAVRRGRTTDALVLCEHAEVALADLFRVALDRWERGGDVRGAVEERGKLVAAELDRYTEALGVTAAVEPLMGLLGTVLGMIKVFHNVSKNATQAGVDVSHLANGIWEALITTAFGLSIAIPVYIGYKYLLSRTDRLVLEIEEHTAEFVDLLDELGPRQQGIGGNSLQARQGADEDDRASAPSSDSAGEYEGHPGTEAGGGQ